MRAECRVRSWMSAQMAARAAADAHGPWLNARARARRRLKPGVRRGLAVLRGAGRVVVAQRRVPVLACERASCGGHVRHGPGVASGARRGSARGSRPGRWRAQQRDRARHLEHPRVRRSSFAPRPAAARRDADQRSVRACRQSPRKARIREGRASLALRSRMIRFAPIRPRSGWLGPLRLVVRLYSREKHRAHQSLACGPPVRPRFASPRDTPSISQL